MQIRIVRQPIGPAPAWVKDAWIGVSLPLAVVGEHKTRAYNLLTMPRSRLGHLWATLRGKSISVSGYYVNAALAVELLDAVRPDAAKWWRDNAADLLDGVSLFIFDSPCAIRLEQA